MAEIKTTRPFQQRFLDGYDRSALREEVQKVKPKRSASRKKYASWALGASLAVGGIGGPMIFHQQHDASSNQSAEAQQPMSDQELAKQIAPDLDQAKSIAQQVAGSMKAVTSGVEQAAAGVTDVAKASTVAQAPQKVAAAVTDSVKEDFFKTQVPFGKIIYQEAVKNNLPPELVAAVVHTESKFKPTARSAAGAQGLMQLVPKTGKWMGAQDLMNPTQNVAAGAKYLRYLSDRFDGDTQKAIAAYNAGEGNVRRFNGVPPFKETRSYITRVRSFQRDLGDRLDNHATDRASAQIADMATP
ncbi:MAG: lytic transglycosylase domain-containing protein [Acidobacteria bacterium]|nr:lytic transglycosylase domain-containing protein [Acidobacteriota bacterium]